MRCCLRSCEIADERIDFLHDQRNEHVSDLLRGALRKALQRTMLRYHVRGWLNVLFVALNDLSQTTVSSQAPVSRAGAQRDNGQRDGVQVYTPKQTQDKCGLCVTSRHDFSKETIALTFSDPSETQHTLLGNVCLCVACAAAHCICDVVKALVLHGHTWCRVHPSRAEET